MTAHQILTSEAHRSVRVRSERGADYGDAVMTCLVVPDEFRRIQTEYPILFRLDAARDTFAAYALFGFEDGENLFLDGDRWDARVLPLAIEIQPFLIGGADRAGARFALVLGESELEAGEVQLKDLTAHEQHAVALDDVVAQLQARLS